MSEMALGPDGKPFWRPWRVRYLTQLAYLGPLLPRWATSRWVLAQALQALQEGSRDRTRRALEIAIKVRGGEGELPGMDAMDAKCKVMDHDWVYRQVFLYELGGLDDFLRRRASADLVAGADRIREWARAPMGAYRLLDRRADVTTWEDIATGAEIRLANIGSGALVVPEERVIGRLVPIEGGSMFEACDRRRCPDGWPRQVAQGPPRDGSTAVLADPGPDRSQRDRDEWSRKRAGQRRTRRDLAVRRPRRQRPDPAGLRGHVRDGEGHPGVRPRAAGDPGRRHAHPSDLDAWACLSAGLLEPGVSLAPLQPIRAGGTRSAAAAG